MPIYEYRCAACKRRVSLFQRSMTTVTEPRCPECGSADLKRLISRFAVVRGEEALLDALDDDSLLSGVDERNPQAVAAWARRMGRKFGDELGGDFEEAVGELESGEGDLDGGDDGGDWGEDF